MGTISITFHGATTDEIARDMAAWLASTGRVTGAPSSSSVASSARDAATIASVVSGVHGEQSRRLLRLLAVAGLRKETLALSTELVREFDVSGWTAFAGMIGPVNRRAKRRLGRELIEYPASDRKARVWRVAPEDAQAVLDALDGTP